jgi:hypothetical protein
MPEGLKIRGSSPGMRDYWKCMIAVFLAGVEAENFYRRQQYLRPVKLPQDDKEVVDSIAAALYRSTRDRTAALRLLRERARQLVSAPGHWLAIERIVQLLQRRVSCWWLAQGLDAEVFLTGDEVRREFDLACGVGGGAAGQPGDMADPRNGLPNSATA